MTEVPAHESTRHEVWDTCNNHAQWGLSWQNPAQWEGLHIHTNCDTKSTTIQGDNRMEPTEMEQQSWDKSQEYMTGIFIEKQEWNIKWTYLEISLKNTWQEDLLKYMNWNY